jgi:hypothetical protein
MVWDSAGAWRQAIFRPTLLRLRGDRLEPREIVVVAAAEVDGPCR